MITLRAAKNSGVVYEEQSELAEAEEMCRRGSKEKRPPS